MNTIKESTKIINRAIDKIENPSNITKQNQESPKEYFDNLKLNSSVQKRINKLRESFK